MENQCRGCELTRNGTCSLLENLDGESLLRIPIERPCGESLWGVPMGNQCRSGDFTRGGTRSR